MPQWVDGQASTLQQLPNAGLDKARDGTQNGVVDLWRRVSEAEIQDREVVDPCPALIRESRRLGVGRYR
jgi:hypothetical protein